MQALDQIKNAPDFAYLCRNRCFEMLHGTRGGDPRRRWKSCDVLTDFRQRAHRRTDHDLVLFTVLLAGQETIRQPAPLILVASHTDRTGKTRDVDSIITQPNQTLRAGAEEPRAPRLHSEDRRPGIKLA